MGCRWWWEARGDVATDGSRIPDLGSWRPRWVYIDLLSLSRNATVAELVGALCVLCLGWGSICACCKIYILSNIVRTL